MGCFSCHVTLPALGGRESDSQQHISVQRRLQAGDVLSRFPFPSSTPPPFLAYRLATSTPHSAPCSGTAACIPTVLTVRSASRRPGSMRCAGVRCCHAVTDWGRHSRWSHFDKSVRIPEDACGPEANGARGAELHVRTYPIGTVRLERRQKPQSCARLEVRLQRPASQSSSLRSPAGTTTIPRPTLITRPCSSFWVGCEASSLDRFHHPSACVHLRNHRPERPPRWPGSAAAIVYLSAASGRSLPTVSCLPPSSGPSRVSTACF